MEVKPQRTINILCSTWGLFATILFFFYIIGDLIMHWWHNAWWVWFIIGLSLLSAVYTSMRYFIFRKSPRLAVPETRMYTDNTQSYIPEEDSSLIPKNDQSSKNQEERKY